jgi:serine/threonine-protein kinase
VSRASEPGDGGGLRRTEAVYFEVAAMLPHERDEAIARLCGGDAALADEVRALLRAGDRVGGFLEQPALGAEIRTLTDVAGFTDPLLGVRLGPFRVERRLASGGMGTVYQAARADGQFEQVVAIKVVKRGMDSEEVVRRFAEERRSLAALNHPNIARLHDAGVTPDGRPYLVMEFVDGLPIDEHCDAKRLGLKDRLRLFRTVCEAVHAAHRALIIHRDLKPSNILVTDGGEVKLLDFGVAKVLTRGAQAAPTADEDRRLTPEYASPEQVRGEPVTTAADVYALGVVLYELLCGRRPYRFATRSTEEIRRLVCDEVPPAPSEALTRPPNIGTGTQGPGPPDHTASAASPVSAGTDAAPKSRGLSPTRLRGLLRGDLDTIVMMALRKEPSRRYASAEQFADDIGRYLAALPVRARADTWGYRVTKFVRRHAAGTVLAAGAVLLLAGAVVVLHGQREQLREQRTELLASNERLAATRDFLVSVLSQGGTGQLGPSAPLSKVLASARQRLRESPPADPITRASFQQAVGRCLMHAGDLEGARELLRAAGETFGRELPGVSDPNLDARQDLAVLRFFEGDAAGAEQELRALLSEERARQGGVASRREADLLNNLGACLRVQKKGDEALGVQREALGVRERLFGADGLEAAESHNNIGSALFATGDLDAARAEFEEALRLRLAKLPPEHALIVRTRSNLGLVLTRAGKSEAAVEHLSAAVHGWEAAFGPDHPGRVSAAVSLAEALRTLRRFEEAEAALRDALAWQERRTPGEAASIAATKANIGVTLAAAGRDADALPLLEGSLPVVRAAGLAGITRSATEALIGVYERSGRDADAETLRRAAPAK